jgi:hypothetical protein
VCVVIVAIGNSHSSVILCKDLMPLSNKPRHDVGAVDTAKQIHL